MQLTSKTIVFIHGFMQNSLCWEAWKTYFETRGYTCFSPDWVMHGGNPADLRKHRQEGVEKLTFKEVYDGLASFIDGLPEKPILVGHSLGKS